MKEKEDGLKKILHRKRGEIEKRENNKIRSFPTNITKEITSRGMRWTGHEARMMA